jgi:hypothetical protein
MLLLRLNAEYNGTKRRNILKRLLDKNSGARKMADKLLPKGTRRRALVKKTYYALRP